MLTERGVLSLAESRRIAAEAAAVDAMAASVDDVIPSDRKIDGEYPVYFAGASGAHLWDVDGNRFVDFMLGYGTVLLGHADARVDEAAFAEIRTGSTLGMMKPAQARLAQLLTETVGGEMAMFMKTGSDATSAAVRIARAATGRDRIVRFGYNGWHDWAAERPTGVLASAASVVDRIPYNDLDALAAVLADHRDAVACIVMMPFLLDPPGHGYLEGVRELTDRHGIVLVFDEMRSGFRMAPGGAQEYFGVRADLATYSKAMANGWEISALVGRADLVGRLADVHISSTFFSNTGPMAAAAATIDVVRDTDALARIWRLGERLQDGLRRLSDAAGVPTDVIGYPPMPFIDFGRCGSAAEDVARTFFTATVRRGIFFHPNHHWYVCAAMGDDDIDAALDAADAGFRAVRSTVLG